MKKVTYIGPPYKMGIWEGDRILQPAKWDAEEATRMIQSYPHLRRLFSFEDVSTASESAATEEATANDLVTKKGGKHANTTGII
jgi:hypothetical protein